MSVYISSPIKMVGMSTKTDFVVEPSVLLETKQTFVIDAREEIDAISAIADELFLRPDRGAYRKGDHEAFISASEKLFTHRDTFEFFPEISQPVYRGDGEIRVKLPGQKHKTIPHPTVGTPITWQQAFEEPINVYNEQGRLLLRSTDSRNGFLFSPNSSVVVTKFLTDLTNYIILKETHWGEEHHVTKNIGQYILPDHEVDQVIEVGLGLCSVYHKRIAEVVRADPWRIYTCSNMASLFMIDTACDYRHYRCNEMLWLEKKEQQDQKHSDLIKTYKPALNHDRIKYEDLEDLFEHIFARTSIRIETIPQFMDVLENTKTNRDFNNLMHEILFEFKQKKQEVTRSTKLVSKLIGTQRSGSISTGFNETLGMRFL